MLGIGAAGGLAWRAYHEIKWYGLRPTAWVMDDAQASNATVARRAYAELLRRLAADELSKEQVQAFVDLALRYRPHTFDRGHPWFRCDQVLDHLVLQERVTDQQRERYAATLMVPMLAARKLVVAGDPVPIRLNYTWLSMNGRLTDRIEIQPGVLLLDERLVAPSEEVTLPSFIGLFSDELVLLPPVEPGSHVLTWRVAVTSENPLIEMPDVLEVAQAFTVVAERAAAPVTRRTVDESTTEYIGGLAQGAFRQRPMVAFLRDDQTREFAEMRGYEPLRYKGMSVGLSLRVDNLEFELPVDLAFDVEVVGVPQPFLLGRFVIVAGDERMPASFAQPFFQAPVPAGLPRTVQLRLVSSESAARRSVFVTEFANVAVDLGEYELLNYCALERVEAELASNERDVKR
jgi:hypothetical protein